MTYLRPNKIAIKLGTSVRFVRDILGKANCREQKHDGKKTRFCYEDVVKYIQLHGKLTNK